MLTGITTSVLTALKTWCARAARSRITIAFFLFVLANCAAQTTLHAMILSGFSQNRGLVTSTIDAAGVQRGFTVVQQGILEICSGIPSVQGTTCYTVYNSSVVSMPASTVSTQCAEGLTWLENYLLESKSEEVVYLVLESWLVVISLIALMDESIPHLIVVLAAQIVKTTWVSCRIVGDISAKHIYDGIIVDGTCEGFDILGGSWQYNMFYVTLGFCIVALLGMSIFVFKLTKLYSNGKLSSVGSPPVITSILHWRLWMRVFLQFTTFFTLASTAVWYDKRKSVTMTSSYSADTLYDVGFYVVAIIIVPWLVLGTYSISNEKRVLFLVYALLSIVLLVISGLWFGSALFRYEYGAWHTFAFMTTLADVLLVVSCILSVICRLNFDKGLAHFLVVEKKLQTAGFAYDTFLSGPSGPLGYGIGVRQAFVPSRPESLPQPAHNKSQSTSKTSKRQSVCSVESAVFATWLSPSSSEDLEKGTNGGERPDSMIIISGENMTLSRAQSFSDSESCSQEVNKKRTIVS